MRVWFCLDVRFTGMVRHVEVGATALDRGALAEGVWEYVSRLVKSYRTKDMEESYQYQVNFSLGPIFDGVTVWSWQNKLTI